MAWSLQGEWIESCSCDMVCRCNFGPEGKPDQGWCSGTLSFEMQEGASGGVNLDGCKVVWRIDLPGVKVVTLSILFDPAKGKAGLEQGDFGVLHRVVGWVQDFHAHIPAVEDTGKGYGFQVHYERNFAAAFQFQGFRFAAQGAFHCHGPVKAR